MENTPPDTSNFLNWVEIKNFKSIRDLRLDCKRVNVFIGKPNVGKSNILEGLGLLGAGYSNGRNSDTYRGGSNGPTNFMKDIIRYDTFFNLFYDQDTADSIEINTDKVSALVKYYGERNEFLLLVDQDKTSFDLLEQRFFVPQNSMNTSSHAVFHTDEGNNFKQSLAVVVRSNGEFNKNTTVYSPIKKYDFKGVLEFSSRYQQFLMPPDGKNLFVVIDQNREIRKEVAKIFDEYKLEFVLSKSDSKFELQKRSDGYVYKYPYSGIADTFQRFVFYITAIESNKNSVIIFEEPEVHSFPPYTQDVAYRMIYSEENQFFVSTHSPYLLQTLVSNLGDDQLNVFVTYYEDYETKVKALTPEELSFVQEYSTDVFFNLDRFVPNAQSANPA